MYTQPEEFSVQKRQCTSMETVDHNKVTLDDIIPNLSRRTHP